MSTMSAKRCRARSVDTAIGAIASIYSDQVRTEHGASGHRQRRRESTITAATPQRRRHRVGARTPTRWNANHTDRRGGRHPKRRHRLGRTSSQHVDVIDVGRTRIVDVAGFCDQVRCMPSAELFPWPSRNFPIGSVVCPGHSPGAAHSIRDQRSSGVVLPRPNREPPPASRPFPDTTEADPTPLLRSLANPDALRPATTNSSSFSPRRRRSARERWWGWPD